MWWGQPSWLMELSFRIGQRELAAWVANLTTEKSSRQLCRHILPVADMEATSYIRYFLALWAVWNVDLNNCPRANAILRHSMCRDERCLPLDARPTLGAVSLVVPIVKAGGHQEQCFVRGERINADVMRCLQSALTFHHADLSQDLRGVTWGEGDLSRPDVHGARLAFGEPLVGTPRGKTSTRSEMEQGDPLAKSRAG